MADRLVFPYVINRQYAPDERTRPFLPVSLRNRHHEVQSLALVDSGADLNVLPYDVGIKLGGIWDEQEQIVGLSGIAGQVESRGFLVEVTVGNWPIIKMGFAWTNEADVPIILGQVSFFSHFNICFMRSRQQFELELVRRQ
ncbi:MAG: hypothetical protein OXE46_07865 [Chloroflexi bacterium]|nr:hypothetical protein [Chloroflexota bacterium]